MNRPPPMRVEPGKPIPARPLRWLAEGVERVLRWRLTAPLVDETVSGIPLPRDARPVEFDALLSGTSSPYSFQEVYGTAGGTWAVLPGGRTGTSNCYEKNAVASLGGKYVRGVHWDGVGAYRFLYHRIGTATGCLLCVKVTCNGTTNLVVGATVTVKSGSTLIGTCTTGGLGTCCVSVPSSGTYAVSVTAPGFANFGPSNYTVTCPGTNNITVDLSNPPTSVCCTCLNCPTTLTLTVDATCTDPVFAGCSDTIPWQAPPAGLASILPNPCYVGNTDFTDPLTGDKFRWYVQCDGLNNRYLLNRAFYTTFGAPPPFVDGSRATYTIGATGNHCSPWLMSNPTLYAGHNPNCNGKVVLSA